MRQIVRLVPHEGWRLEVEFADGAVRWFDAKPLLSCAAFEQLRDPAMFASVRSGGYYVEWSNGADLSADTLFLEGVPRPAELAGSI